ncbi:MAG: CotH kinase family protein, partial [Verrucomicrobiota bacterium]|nr:CotH kinase family protein [Verrucomicrobiota bacterium]
MDKLKTTDDFFQDTKIWGVALTVSPENYTLLEPKSGGGFGVDFEYVRANVAIAGRFFEDVGLRYKGNSSFSTARDIQKKSFKIDFNRFVKGQKFLGLTKLNLNNNVLDPSQIREALAYRLWRKLELPGSKTTFARVTLTVPGRYDKKLLGLYVVVEQVNGPFLEERFGTDKGLLLKPERSLSMPYLGEAFAEYERVYVPKSSTKPRLAKRLIAFTWLVNQADDMVFAEQIGGFVELEHLARFTAVHAVLSHLDSFLLRGHNYYLYLPKANGRFVFL